MKLHKATEETGQSGNSVVYAFSLLFLSAYVSYLVAEVSGLSGIIRLLLLVYNGLWTRVTFS